LSHAVASKRVLKDRQNQKETVAMTPFPPWTARLGTLLPVIAVSGLVYITALVWYGASPKTTDVGYAPVQPVPFSHALHAGKLGMDCRYCHNSVERSAKAAVPATATCMNCHARIRTDSPALAPVRESFASGKPVPWVRVHDMPDYVYFNHSAHVTRGVGCVTCHGRIDTMDRVRQEKTLSMSFCLDCHRSPDAELRPQEFLTTMDWKPTGNAQEFGARLREVHNVKPATDCSTCHR
jgi:menaquinone reductase, multiheme cytochrome c subunit